MLNVPLQVKNGKYGPPQAKKNELIRTPLGIFGDFFGVNKDPPKISDFEILMKIRTPPLKGGGLYLQ